VWRPHNDTRCRHATGVSLSLSLSLSLFVSLSLSSTVCCDESRVLKATHRDWVARRARPSSHHRQGDLANGMAHDVAQRVPVLRTGGWPTAPRPTSKRATTAGRRNSSVPSPKGKQRASRNGAALRVSGSRVRERESTREFYGRGTCERSAGKKQIFGCALLAAAPPIVFLLPPRPQDRSHSP